MKNNIHRNAPSGVVYGLGFIGAAIFLLHMQQAFGWESLDFSKQLYGLYFSFIKLLNS